MNASKQSSAGYHFFNAYQQCPWAWYLRYVVHLEPTTVSKFLSFGTAVHAALESFYVAARDALSWSVEDMVAAGLASLASLKTEYASADDFDSDVVRLPPMVRKWHAEHALSDLRDYDIVDVEREIVFALPLDMRMTARKDVTLRDRVSKQIVVHEHKTTSRSVGQMASSVACSLQPDAQILATAADLGVDPSTVVVVPDIVYQRQSIVSAERPFAISRSRRELADAALHFAGLALETTAKVASLDGTRPPELVFPRNGAWCGAFSCAYADICRQPTPVEKAPVGFRFTSDDESTVSE